MERAIVYILKSTTAVIDRVGDRVFPQVAEQGCDRPFLVFNRIDTPRVRHQGGSSGLASPRIQIDCWDDSYIGVKAVARAVRDALDDYRGTIGFGGSQTDIRRIICDDEADSETNYPAGSDRHLRHVRLDFIVWHKEE